MDTLNAFIDFYQKLTPENKDNAMKMLYSLRADQNAVFKLNADKVGHPVKVKKLV